MALRRCQYKDQVVPIHVRIITPIVTEGVRSLDDIASLQSDDLHVSQTLIDIGPASIESEFDEALSAPGLLAKAIEAEREGVDALVIDCMGDPGLKPAREVLSIPILGPSETCMHIAAMLGGQFGFITVLESVRPMISNLAKLYGVSEKMASIRVVNIPVLEIDADPVRLNAALANQAAEAVERDGAGVIVLGCTGFFGCAEFIAADLAARGLSVPVIDPIPTTVRVAAALARTGLSHSKRTYPVPPNKPLKGFQLPEFRF
jgi:allantoin racemase